MKVIITKNYDDMSKKANEVMREVVKANPNGVLGLATGSTPIGLYKCMAEDNKKGITSYKTMRTVNLDEYIGLGEKDDQSYVYFMRDNLFNHVDIDIKNTNLPNGKASDMQAECDRYNKLLDSVKVNIQLLGLGGNGHIGFNEPNTPFDSVTHVIDLTENTIKDNARFFASINDVPTKAVSMGISNIMKAEKVLIVASGANKAKAVKAMLEGEINPICPASALRNHPDCTVVIDEAAASMLTNKY